MATVQPLTFVPTSISGCRLWLDGADSSTVVRSGNTVTQWTDKSGFNNNFTVLLGGPTYSSNGILFSRSNTDVMLSSSNITFAANTSFIFYVAQLVNAGSDFNDFISFTTTNVVIRYNNGGNGILIGTPSSGGDINDFANANMYVNGTFNPTSVAATYTSNHLVSAVNQNLSGSVAVRLSDTFLSRYFGGRAYEILIYTGGLTTSQRQSVEGYLAWKWGLQANLPTTHPFYYIAPNSQGLGIPPGLRLAAPVQSFQTSSVGLPFLNPTSLSGIQLWLDGQDPNGTGVVPSNGASVSTWVDKSGVGNNGTAGGSTPSYTLATRGVTFSSGYYNTNYSASLTTETVFLVFISPTLTDFQRMMSSTGGGRELFLNAAGSLFAKSVATGDMVNTGSGTITGNTTILMTYQLTSAANPVIYTFGTLRGTGSYVTLSAGRTTAIGYLPGGGNNFVGTMFEIIGYNTSLSTYNRQQVEGYLAWKWGLVASLPSSHPFKTRSPVLVQFPSTRNLGQGAFSPVRVANCVLWLDASDRLTVVLSGSSVTGWNDKSGNGNNAYNTPGALLPTYSTTAFNSGYPGLVFTTTVDNPGYTPAPSNSTVMFFPNCQGASNDASYFAVYQPGDTTGRTVLNNYKNQYTLWYSLVTTGVYSTVAPTANPAGISYTATTNPTFADFTMASGSTNTFTGGQNGSVSVVTQTVTPQGTGVDNNPLGAIGAYYESYTSGNPYFGNTYKGTISEVLIFVRALSTAERQSVEGYLAWKWGLVGNLPATHPYKKFPPPPN